MQRKEGSKGEVFLGGGAGGGEDGARGVGRVRGQEGWDGGKRGRVGGSGKGEEVQQGIPVLGEVMQSYDASQKGCQ